MTNHHHHRDDDRSRVIEITERTARLLMREAFRTSEANCSAIAERIIVAALDEVGA